MNNTATELRQGLKALGYSNRKVSVREQQGGLSTALYVTIKCASVDREKVEALAASHEHVDRCERSQEILAGGNTYIFVDVRLR